MKKGVIAAVIAVLAVVLIAVLVMGKEDKKDTTGSSSSSNTTNDSNSSDSTQPAGQSSSAVETDKVGINDMAFEFKEIKVKKGTTVTWTNNDGVPHNVIGENNTGPQSDTLDTGDTYSFTFNEVGTFSYECTFHPGMTAKVTVVE
jgi:amicyanin